MEYNYDDPDNDFEFVVGDIWINKKDKTYHFADEVGGFYGPYQDIDECKAAMQKYVRDFLS